MSEPELLVRRVGEMKAVMDNGFSRVGPNLDAKDPVQGWLQGAGSRSIALADAVVQLCRRGHANEAGPVLRGLIETVAALAWVAAADGSKRLAEYRTQTKGADWATLWDLGRLAERLRAGGLPAATAEGWLEALRGHPAKHVTASSAGLPWCHVYPENKEPGPEPETMLVLAADALSLALDGLHRRWPEAFPKREERCS